MKELVKKCEEYSKKWLMNYNTNKSVILNCGYQMYKDEDIDIRMNDKRIPVIEASKYLGVMLNKKNEDDTQVLDKFKKVQSAFFGLSAFGIKPPGVKPSIKAFLYNTYCKPIGTYGFGVMNVKKKTIQQLNIMQNNMIRYTLGIPQRSHTSKLMRALGIIDNYTTYLMDKCTTIKLLHRTDLTKELLMKNITDRNETWWFYGEIKEICVRLDIEPEEVCLYPDRTRKKLQENYFCELNEGERENIEEIRGILDNYNYRNKKKLVELTKIEWQS